MPPKSTKMNVVSKKSNLSSGLLTMKFMRQAETKDRQDEKEKKRQILVDSSHWTLSPTNKFGDVDSSPLTVEEDSLGFSDILDVTSISSTTQSGRRGYGKFANQSEDEESEDDDEESTPKRKKNIQTDDDSESEDPEEKKKKNKANFKILRQMKSISNSNEISKGLYSKKSRTK